jgi:hypothetical protein
MNLCNNMMECVSVYFLGNAEVIVMHEHGSERSDMMEMIFRERLTEEQQKMLLLRSLDLKIKMKTMHISTMRDKIMLMEEKLEIIRTMRDMIKGSC